MKDERERDEIREAQKLALALAEATHDLDVCLSTRTIFLGEEIDGESVNKLMKNLHVLSSLGDGRITLVMNNVGGDVYHGMAAYDSLMTCRTAIRVVVRGHAMSMGSVILQAADERWVGPNSTQLLHYGTTGFSGHSKDMAKWAAEEERVNEWMESIYLERIQQVHPTYTLRRLRKLLAHDTFLSAQQSVDLGVADLIA